MEEKKVASVADRVKELRRVKASELVPNPLNWRTHPQEQRDAMEGMLEEVGYAGALIARELSDGRLELLDGHLRAETTPDQEVPVLVVELNDEEAATLLALYDPLAAMAGKNRDILTTLLDEVETNNAALESTILDIVGRQTDEQIPSNDFTIPEAYQIVIDCNDEEHQRELFETLREQGLKCRVVTL